MRIKRGICLKKHTFITVTMYNFCISIYSCRQIFNYSFDDHYQNMNAVCTGHKYLLISTGYSKCIRACVGLDNAY